ncbi:hypothetical protein BKA70DRAFT_1237635 [Coprinopsis sp. MPI-PUGE-AT-0042]|nr:hypothetical protein BKA70DRAFT_1237635 [Coprinopsis sp. MPI-PUGE-AT-0042]
MARAIEDRGYSGASHSLNECSGVGMRGGSGRRRGVQREGRVVYRWEHRMLCSDERDPVEQIAPVAINPFERVECRLVQPFIGFVVFTAKETRSDVVTRRQGVVHHSSTMMNSKAGGDFSSREQWKDMVGRVRTPKGSKDDPIKGGSESSEHDKDSGHNRGDPSCSKIWRSLLDQSGLRRRKSREGKRKSALGRCRGTFNSMSRKMRSRGSGGKSKLEDRTYQEPFEKFGAEGGGALDTHPDLNPGLVPWGSQAGSDVRLNNFDDPYDPHGHWNDANENKHEHDGHSLHVMTVVQAIYLPLQQQQQQERLAREPLIPVPDTPDEDDPVTLQDCVGSSNAVFVVEHAMEGQDGKHHKRDDGERQSEREGHESLRQEDDGASTNTELDSSLIPPLLLDGTETVASDTGSGEGHVRGGREDGVLETRGEKAPEPHQAETTYPCFGCWSLLCLPKTKWVCQDA